MQVMSETLFDMNPEWEEHWRGMPEFIQEDKESVAHVVVHFETMQDLQAFSELTGLIITDKTKGIFFPPKEPGQRMVWVSES